MFIISLAWLGSIDDAFLQLELHVSDMQTTSCASWALSEPCLHVDLKASNNRFFCPVGLVAFILVDTKRTSWLIAVASAHRHR